MAEKRLIDANALRAVLKKEECNCEVFPWALDNAPTVDAVEVVHSQWDTVFYERNGTLATYSHICPVCKYFYRDTRFNGHKYCPDCGAKMDGGTGDGQS